MMCDNKRAVRKDVYADFFLSLVVDLAFSVGFESLVLVSVFFLVVSLLVVFFSLSAAFL